MSAHLLQVFIYTGERGWSQDLSVVPSDTARDKGHKLRHRQFPLNIRKHFAIARVTEHLQFARGSYGVSVHGGTLKPSGAAGFRCPHWNSGAGLENLQ